MALLFESILPYKLFLAFFPFIWVKTFRSAANKERYQRSGGLHFIGTFRLFSFFVFPSDALVLFRSVFSVVRMKFMIPTDFKIWNSSLRVWRFFASFAEATRFSRSYFSSCCKLWMVWILWWPVAEPFLIFILGFRFFRSLYMRIHAAVVITSTNVASSHLGDWPRTFGRWAKNHCAYR